MRRAYIGLGTNLGQRKTNLKEALIHLDRHEQMEVAQVSGIYETAPVGLLEQPDFLNVCAEVRTSLSPRELLEAMLQVERKLHRVRTIRWGPRTIDLDLLLLDHEVISEPQLTVPHPRMTERAFVLIPLAEIALDVVIPPTGRTVGEWLQVLGDKEGVRLHPHQWGPDLAIAKKGGVKKT
nr:2-amino-4-hydroxy-6-hydroxymethyldihydropteridine diphosphokinase [Desmospora activa]